MKWEYLLTTFARNNLMIDELKKLGEQGWETVAMTTEGHILMKRTKTVRTYVLDNSRKND